MESGHSSGHRARFGEDGNLMTAACTRNYLTRNEPTLENASPAWLGEPAHPRHGARADSRDRLSRAPAFFPAIYPAKGQEAACARRCSESGHYRAILARFCEDEIS